MNDRKPSTPNNVVLPGFQETFSEVLRRYPVESPRRGTQSPSTSDNGEIDIRRTRPVQHASATCSPTAAMREPQPAYMPFSQSSSLSGPQRPLNNPWGVPDSAASTHVGTSRRRISPDHASQQDETESSEGVRVRKKHICSICDKDFLRPSSLETHMNSHTGAKPHKCSFPGCEKYFSAKSNMKRHLRKHLSPDDDDNDTGDYESAG